LLCFVMRTIKPIMSLKSLRMIYYAYMHSIKTYGIIFWGNSSYTVKLFRIQKNVIRIMMGLKKRDSYRDSFKEMEILPLCSQYIYSLMLHTLIIFTCSQEILRFTTLIPDKILIYFSQVLHSLKSKRELIIQV
jgi:hypothetical protein